MPRPACDGQMTVRLDPVMDGARGLLGVRRDVAGPVVDTPRIGKTRAGVFADGGVNVHDIVLTRGPHGKDAISGGRQRRHAIQRARNRRAARSSAAGFCAFDGAGGFRPHDVSTADATMAITSNVVTTCVSSEPQSQRELKRPRFADGGNLSERRDGLDGYAPNQSSHYASDRCVDWSD